VQKLWCLLKKSCGLDEAFELTSGAMRGYERCASFDQVHTAAPIKKGES
jgi:hypothetical protein